MFDIAQSIIAEDVSGIRTADGDANYGGSWKRRGGVGAFMMLARKWDRIERRGLQHSGDLFDACEKDTRSEGVIDDIRDLRRYCLLVLSEVLRLTAPAEQVVSDEGEVGYVSLSAEQTRLGHLAYLGTASGTVLDALPPSPEFSLQPLAVLWSCVESGCSPVGRNPDAWRSIFTSDRNWVIKLAAALLALEAGLREKGIKHGKHRDN